jgi:hypothetical protein
MIDISRRFFEICHVPASDNPYYAVTKFRFRLDIHRRIYRNFEGELFENIVQPTSNIP